MAGLGRAASFFQLLALNSPNPSASPPAGTASGVKDPRRPLPEAGEKGRLQRKLVSVAFRLALKIFKLALFMPDSSPDPCRCEARLTVSLADAKNHLSALVARVEQGEEIAITRRGVPVVRLVPDPGDRAGRAGRHERVGAAL